MKKTKKIILSVLAVIIAALLVFSLIFMIKKDFFKDPANFMQLAKNKIVLIYNKLTNKDNDFAEEIILQADGKKAILNHGMGYSLELPGDMNIDTTLAAEQIKAFNDDMTVIITREWAPYEDVVWYIDNYMDKYNLKEIYQKTNNITFFEEAKKYKFNDADAKFYSLRRNVDTQTIKRQNDYAYFYVTSTTGKQAFFRIMFKSYDYEKSKDDIKTIINSFKEIPISKESKLKTDFHPVPLESWTDETVKLWNEINSHDGVSKWGIFIDAAYQKDEQYRKLENLEKKLDMKFDFALHYVNLNHGFPIDELNKIYADGKIAEMTLQISNHSNANLDGKNMNFDMYDGKMDEQIREFARGAKKFGHPFLFRLNNEMNSDWVNYSGIAALSDPEIFIENWRRIYNIFAEEGVNNAIWIYNPNAEDCPPAHWNSYISYYPGNEYVHLIGLTGYNTGTYYEKTRGEKWRTFDEIYKETYDKYMKVFSKFPFIITEFSSSSIGGDKAAWITDMFNSLAKYDNIKMALWWSHVDYDILNYTYEDEVIARPYWLDETEATTKAFKQGIEKFKAEKK